jgi:SAM-dependent methyltransferase
MDDVLYDSIRRLEETNWWFVGMRSIARSLMSDFPRFRRAVDIGCGSGGNLELLRSVADEVLALDLSPRALAYTRDRIREGAAPTGLAAGDAQRLPLRDRSVDLAWLFNVIEHLPDDRAAARELARVLRPHGIAVVATSASMWLWSDHDVANHHQRRYARAELEEILSSAGLRIRRITHANTALFAPVAVVAAAQRLRAHVFGRRKYERNAVAVSPAVDRVLRALLEAEGVWLRRADLPIGVTLFALAEKS